MSDLTAEAIEAITELAKASVTKTTTFIRRPGDPPHIVYTVDPDGNAVSDDTVSPPLAIKLADPKEMCKYSTKEATADEGSAISELYYSETGLTLILDKSIRRDRATCPLTKTPQFALIEAGCGGLMDQKVFLRRLRIDFRGCLVGANGSPGDSLIGLIRNIRWEGSSNAEADIQHGRESMGKAVKSQVHGSDKLPEEVFLKIKIWEERATDVIIACALEIFPETQRFQLVPFPGVVRAAIDVGLDELAEYLEEEQNAPIYRGQP